MWKFLHNWRPKLQESNTDRSLLIPQLKNKDNRSTQANPSKEKYKSLPHRLSHVVVDIAKCGEILKLSRGSSARQILILEDSHAFKISKKETHF